MAIIQRKDEEIGSLDQKVQKGFFNDKAIKFAMDNAQIDQYKHPIKSCVRELMANAIDAIRKVEIIRLIYSGQKKISDYFVDRTDEPDSKFNLEDYNLSFFCQKNEVVCKYLTSEEDGWNDKFIVKDTGTGMNPRIFLHSVTDLYFSTKRNTKSQLGGFGIGGKSPLATEAPYYIVKNVWNGMLFKAKCFKDETIFEGQYDEDFNECPYVEVEGVKLYYSKTTEPNGVEVEVPCKRYMRKEYRDGVTSQFQFCEDIRFFFDEEEVFFQEKIVFENENILIPQKKLYKQPFVVMTIGEKDKICYGMIDYPKMDKTPPNACIGIKCQMLSYYKQDGVEYLVQDGVEVIKSREELRYSSRTEAFLTKKIREVEKDAEDIVNQSYKTDKLLDWLNLLSSNLRQNNNALDELAKLADISSVKPSFFPQPKIKPLKNARLFFSVYDVRVINCYADEKYFKTNKFFDVGYDSSSSDFYNHLADEVYYIDEDVSLTNLARKIAYLCSLADERKVTIIKRAKKSPVANDLLEIVPFGEDREKLQFYFWSKIKEEAINLLTLQLDIPEEWGIEEVVEVDRDEEVVEKTKTSIFNLRFIQSYSQKRTLQMKDHLDRSFFKHFEFEIGAVGHRPIEKQYNLKTFATNNPQRTYYFTNTGEIEFAKFISSYTLNSIKGDVEFLVLPKAAFKYLRYSNFKRIEELIIKINNNTLMSSLKKAFTAKFIADNISKFSFLENFSRFNPEVFNIYQELKQYYRLNYIKNLDVTTEDSGDKVISLLSKLAEFQIQIRNLDSEQKYEAIANVLKLEGVDEIDVVDEDIYIKVKMLLEFAEGKELLCYIPELNTQNSHINENLYNTVKTYIGND